VLVISTKSEIRYIHHRYRIAEIGLAVPLGVEVVREQREPSGSGVPDLSEPGKRPDVGVDLGGRGSARP